MIKITVFPGRYVQGKGAMNDLGREMARFGKGLSQRTAKRMEDRC